MWVAFASGHLLGDRYWHREIVQHFIWGDMAQYLDVNPDVDRGQSYMDAGTMYFKEGSYVLADRAVAFHSGSTYCVAPIARAPEQPATQAINGFALPTSGTVDFWAVGTDCCGVNGEAFECGDSRSVVARAGLRVVDETQRSMYLLGVQEFSATTGVPVRHPLFFSWVRDPVRYNDGLQSACLASLISRTTACFLISAIAATILHVLMRKASVA